MGTKATKAVFCQNTYMGLDTKARVLLLAASILADGNGVLPGSPRWLKARVFPGDCISLYEVEMMIDALLTHEFCTLFRSDEDDLFMQMSFEGVNVRKDRYPEPPAHINRIYADAAENEAVYVLDEDQPLPPMCVPLANPRLAYQVSESALHAWQNEYRHIDVRGEIKALIQWNIDNLERRKTHRGISRHIGGWLRRAQRRADRFTSGSGRTAATSRSQNVAARRIEPQPNEPGRAQDAMQAFSEYDA